MQLECFATTARPPDIVPGRPQRAWMEAFADRHAYRCLPLTMANTSGWEILCPVGFTAEWTGGPSREDITFKADHPHPDFHYFVASHFTQGVITFHPGYLFRTPPGWSVWCGGPPNHVKDGVQALEGLVETDWLPYPFTMNWIFTRPGRVRFERAEPFCFFTLVQDKPLDTVDVVMRSLDADPDLRGQYEAWTGQREAFLKGMRKGDPETLQAAWQRFYFKGEGPDAEAFKPHAHVNKRRLAAPRAGR